MASLSLLICLSRAVTVAFVTLPSLPSSASVRASANASSSPICSCSNSSSVSVDTFHLGRQLLDLFLLAGIVAGNQKLLRNEIAGPSLVDLLTRLTVFALLRLDHPVSLSFPSVSGDQVAIVLHRLIPEVHQVLVDIVGVDERLALIVMEQPFGVSAMTCLGWQLTASTP